MTSPKNFLSSDVLITGSVKIGSDLTCHGTINGDVQSQGALSIAVGGTINGDVRTKAVVIAGTVNGNVTASEKCELEGDSKLIGDLEAPRLVIAAGATFIGNSKVVPQGVTIPNLPSTPAPSAPATQPGQQPPRKP